MKGASKGYSAKVKKNIENKKKKPVYKKGETPYDKRREAYKKQLIRENRNAGYVDMEEDELEAKVNKRYPLSKEVK